MKLNIFETHDRLLHFKKNQSEAINEGVDACLKKNPLSLALQRRSHYIYIFGHPRTADDGVNKRFLWQPRLGRPKPQTNSYLFRAVSNTDVLEICWMIPPKEMWSQYEDGNITESKEIQWSIDQYLNHREDLAKPFSDDFPKERINEILLDIAKEMEEEIRIKKLYAIKV
jgi:hypothetical protein